MSPRTRMEMIRGVGTHTQIVRGTKGMFLVCIVVFFSPVWCVAVCCSVSQCVAVCRSVLQCVAVYCTDLLFLRGAGEMSQVHIGICCCSPMCCCSAVAMRCAMCWCVAVHCSVMCCCSVVQVWCSVMQGGPYMQPHPTHVAVC